MYLDFGDVQEAHALLCKVCKTRKSPSMPPQEKNLNDQFSEIEFESDFNSNSAIFRTLT